MTVPTASKKSDNATSNETSNSTLAEVAQKKEIHSTKAKMPAAKSLLNTKEMEQDNFDKFSQNIDIPIDELRALSLKVSPTFKLDKVESAILKSFRKVIGYDTFDSILKKDRMESKDPADYYNITISLMVRRDPAELAKAPAKDPYSGK